MQTGHTGDPGGDIIQVCSFGQRKYVPPWELIELLGALLQTGHACDFTREELSHDVKTIGLIKTYATTTMLWRIFINVETTFFLN